MSLALAISSYFVIWWVVLFAVLPFGVRNAEEAGLERAPGTDAGAPAVPHLAWKALATTLVSGLVLAALYAYIAYVS